MATEFLFCLDDKPGAFADVAEILGDAGVNILGGLGQSVHGQGLISLVTDNVQAAQSALDVAGIQYESKEAVIVQMQHGPGELAKLTHALARAGINLSSLYITVEGKVVFCPADLPAAKKVAKNLGVLCD
ncbi:hypothetical protein JYU14_04570 [Simkania negevensis]|uniref:ACT domain-containing protein n=1 Tax=Simkania negevensis TaxID=83561 RepID=A0ABS3ARJ4_9BACT|nr:hypothetical protein [Simkania negevensis]